MKLPLAKGTQQKFIAKRQCPVCKRGGLHEPNSFAFVSLGALDQTGEAFLPQHWGAFFNIGWHGAHSDMGGEGELPDSGGFVNIVDDFVGGQIEIYFCSTNCLRAFMNSCVDQLEKKIHESPTSGA